MRYSTNGPHVGAVYDNDPSLGVAVGHAVAFCRGTDNEANKLAERIADALNKTPSDDIALAAMCLWEAVVDGRPDEPWDDDRENKGTCDLRDRILALAPQCDADWRHAQQHMGFDDSFDWEFAPQWLRHNYGQDYRTPEKRMSWLCSADCSSGQSSEEEA